MVIRKTPLYDTHVAAKGKMVDFAGWNMPIQYNSIVDECKRLRAKCGICDVSHMGEIEIKGANALSFLSYVTCNDPSILEDGEIQYSALLNNEGGIIDDLLIYRVNETRYLLCVNASNTKKDFDWLTEKAKDKSDVEVSNRSYEYGMISVQGPNAVQALRIFFRLNLNTIPYYEFTTAMFEDTNILVSRTGYTGEDGFELLVPWRDTKYIWEKIVSKGKNSGVTPVGLGARDLLRLEMRYPLHGSDIDAMTTPLEAGLSWIVKLDKEDEFIGKEALLRQKENGVPRIFVGLKMVERGIPRAHYPILSAEGENIGEVTSGGHSPTLNAGIAMGYVKPEFSNPGQKIAVEIRGKAVSAEVAPQGPFVKSRVRKDIVKKAEPQIDAAENEKSETEIEENGISN